MDASTWIALVALVISVVAAIMPFISRKLSQRHALVTAWFAITAGGSGMSDRLILMNRGPAEAKDIEAYFVNFEGQVWTPWIGGNSSPLPVPLLAPGDQFHIPIAVILGTGEYVHVTLNWRDGAGAQIRKTTLSLIGVPLGDASGIVAVESAIQSLTNALKYS